MIKPEKYVLLFIEEHNFPSVFWCWIFAWWGESAYLNDSNFSVTSKLEFRFFFFGHCSTIQKSLLCPVFRSLSSFTVFRDAGFFAQKDILKVKFDSWQFLNNWFCYFVTSNGFTWLKPNIDTIDVALLNHLHFNQNFLSQKIVRISWSPQRPRGVDT